MNFSVTLLRSAGCQPALQDKFAALSRDAATVVP
jgi:hypothetical protein